LTSITEEEAPEEEAKETKEAAPAAAPSTMDEEEAGDYYDRAVAIVLRDRKVSTSYIQRRLSVGYNKAASLVERMEKSGVVSAPNHAGKREILLEAGADRAPFDAEDEE
jgi:S-DNA-T family DNA segregation ATPase FtsK/SpoIIIE